MNNNTTILRLSTGQSELGVAPGVGGSIVYYRWIDGARRYDWLRSATNVDLAAGTSDRLACFPLVPFSNRIRDGSFDFGGRSIKLPLNQWPERHAEHGHGWQSAWDVIERGADRLTLEYNHPADLWPFPYRAVQAFELSDDALTVTLAVENRGRTPMPIGLGLHPYFPRTPHSRLAAQVDAMWATDAEVMPTALVDADRRLRVGDGLPVDAVALDNVFTGWRGQATIHWPELGAQLLIDAGTPLGFLVIYSPPGADFFCAEPVSHCTDAFNLAAQGRPDTGMLTLEPGATLPATVRFRPSLAEPRRLPNLGGT